MSDTKEARKILRLLRESVNRMKRCSRCREKTPTVGLDGLCVSCAAIPSPETMRLVLR